MHETIPTSEPTTLRAGDTWSWDRAVSDHLPSDGWSLSYVLRSGATVIEVTAAGSENHFEVRQAGSISEKYTPGQYRLVGRVSKDAERYTVYDDVVTVEPDPAEGRASFSERMIARIEAELEARVSGQGDTAHSWSQGGRSEELTDETELRRQLGYYREQVRVERGGPVIVPGHGRFTNA